MMLVPPFSDLGIPMPSLTAQNYRVVLNRLIDHDPEKVRHYQCNVESNMLR